MYRCKECGAEFEEKPDYCDCGNDEFEEFGIEKNLEQQVQKTDNNKSDNAGQVSPDKSFEQNKPMPASSMRFSSTETISEKQTFSERYPEFSSLKKSLDPISLIIFCGCILLSLYIVFFAWNPKNVNIVEETKQEINTPKNIPSIDKFWNNALPVVKQEQPQPKQAETNIIKQIVNIPEPKKEKVVPQAVKPVAKPKVTVVPLKKITTQKTIAKPASTPVKQQSSSNAQAQAKKQAEDLAKQKAEAERKKAEAEQLKKLQAEQAKKQAEQKAKQAQINKQELVSYKANLRNTLARRIDFTKVIGDGSCTVSFRIDSTGRLINRSFSKQSSNNTLNDAVYNAVMSMPTFNPPPSAYNNEVLNLGIRFYNGNFEISLP